MRLLLILDIGDDDLAWAYRDGPPTPDDIRRALTWRLTMAGMFGPDRRPVAGHLALVREVTDHLDLLLDAAEAGFERADADRERADAAWATLRALDAIDR